MQQDLPTVDVSTSEPRESATLNSDIGCLTNTSIAQVDGRPWVVIITDNYQNLPKSTENLQKT